MNAGAGAEATGLREVHGPAAFGGDLRRFRRLLWSMARTEFRLRFHGSVLGYLWPLLSPLFLFAVLYVAFTEIVRVGRGIENYAVILLFNVMLYTFFTEASGRAVTSLVIRESIVRKAEFPRVVIPLAAVMTAVMTLGFSLVVVIGFIIANGVPARWSWLLVPLPILGVVLLAVGCALLLSSLYVRLRDVSQIWSVLTRAGFYATPVIFTVELYPADWRGLLFVNPLAPLLAQARVWLVDPSAPSYTDVMGGSVYLLGPVAIGAGICLLGAWYFKRRAPRVGEEL